MLGPLLSTCGGVWPTSPGRWAAASRAPPIEDNSEGRDGLLWWRDLTRCHAGEVSIVVAQIK
jgi:pyruvate dehydrogenase phosphatase